MKRFTYANVAATAALVIAIGLTPAGAHVTDSLSHLWDDHIEPKLSQAGKINKSGNPVHWTKLKGVPKGIADGKDAAAPKNVVRYDRIKVVSGNGTPAQNGTRLVNALAAANGATEDKPRLIQLEPGTFELVETLATREHVQIAGSGRRATTILMNDSAPAGVMIDLNSNSSLRDLAVQRLNAPVASDPSATAVRVPQNAVSTRFEGVDIHIQSLGQAPPQTDVQGIRAEGETLLEAVEVVAGSASGNSFAVYSTGPIDIRHSSLNASGVHQGIGINALWASQGSTATVTDSLLTSNGAFSIAARASHGGSIYLKDSFVNGGHFGAANEGPGTLTIKHSDVYGGTDAVQSTGGTARVAFSELENGTSGPVTCASNVTPTLQYFETTCPT